MPHLNRSIPSPSHFAAGSGTFSVDCKAGAHADTPEQAVCPGPAAVNEKDR